MVTVERWASELRAIALQVQAAIPQAARPQKLQRTHDDLVVLAERLERLAVQDEIDRMQAREDQARAQRLQLESHLAQRPDV